MASLSHGLTKSTGLEEAIKRIIKQHQRECENAGEFRKAREARAALQEIQHHSELEGLCRLFCRHYTQLSGAENAYEKHLRTLDVSWQTQQLPELLEKVRRWRQQLKQRHEEELAALAPSKTEEACAVLRPRFKKEAFDLQKKVLFLGHQGRYDEAEELQKKLAVRQRMDAAEHQAVLKARRERQTQRLLTAQEAERHSLESKVERLVNYHNKQNAEAIDVLRRKYLGQRKSLIHNQALETQKYLHGLKSFTPHEAVRMASSVVNSQWSAQGKPLQMIGSSEGVTGCLRSNNVLRVALGGEDKENKYETAAGALSKGVERQAPAVEAQLSEGSSQLAKIDSSNGSSQTRGQTRGMQGETRKKQWQPLLRIHSDQISRPDRLPVSLRGPSTCLHRLAVPLRSLATDAQRSLHGTQNSQSWKRNTTSRQPADGNRESVSQRRPPYCHQEATKRQSNGQLHGSTRDSQLKGLTGEGVVRVRSTEKDKWPEADALRDEIFKAWKECAAKVTNELTTTETLR